MKKAWLLVFAFFFCAEIIAQRSLQEATLFTVNERPVDAGEFLFAFRKNATNVSQKLTRQSVEEYLDLYINFKLKVEEARQRRMDTTAAFKEEFESYHTELLKPYLPEEAVIDSMTVLTYNRLKEEVHAAHLMVAVAPDASPEDTAKAYQKILEFKRRIENGEDFTTLAGSVSEDPSARTNKGDLGYFTALGMVYPFENAAFQTPVGEIAGPVRTNFGYHLIKVLDHRPSWGRVEVAHLMIRSQPGSQHNEKARIDSLYNQLMNGASWDDLVNRFSDDVGSRAGGGKLQPFGVESAGTLPGFVEAAYALENPGDISKPVQTPYGWHILKLVAKHPLPPFEKLKEELKSRVARDERSQVSMAARWKQLEDAFGVRVVEDSRKKLDALASDLFNRNADVREFDSMVLYHVGETEVKAGEFIRFVRSLPTRQSRVTPEFLDFLYSEFRHELVRDRFEKELLKSDSTYRYLLNEYYEGILLFNIMEQEVWSKAAADTLGQARYFETHADDFQREERVEAVIYQAPSRKTLTKLSKMLTGEDHASAEQLIEGENIKYTEGEFARADHQGLNGVRFEEGVHTAKSKDLFYLVVIRKVHPPARRSMEEAGTELITQYQNYLEHQWIEQLKKHYPVQINETAKKALLDHLL